MPDPVPVLDSAFVASLPRVQEAIAELERAIGGRQALTEAFLAAPPDPDRDLLLGLVADPRNDRRSLATLCEEAHLTAGELLALYRSAVVAKAQILAIHEVAAQTPAVARDVMRRAQNHYRFCATCRSAGEVWEPIKDAKGKATGDRQRVPCVECDGTGEILTDASIDHQKLALDLAGMIAKAGPATVVAVDASTHQLSIGAAPFALLQKAVQKVLDPPQMRPLEIEATIVPEAPPSSSV